MSATRKAAFEPPIQRLTYVIDLNERGYFRAHVENTNGRLIFNFSNEEDEDGTVWLVEDGFMRNVHDVTGLHDYLKSVRLAKPNSTISIQR